MRVSASPARGRAGNEGRGLSRSAALGQPAIEAIEAIEAIGAALRSFRQA
jgi:hypothetical protein